MTISRLLCRKAGSLEEVISHATHIADLWYEKKKGEEIWFRGVSRREYKLIPSAYRKENSNLNELAMFDKFRSWASPYLDVYPKNEWEWYFLAQHYGVPTRLLDWTENLLAAVYFSLASEFETAKFTYSFIRNKSRHEAKLRNKRVNVASPVVWIIDAGWINATSISDEDDAPYSSDQEFCSYWLPANVIRGEPRKFRFNKDRFSNDRPIAVLPIRANPRIVSQQGMFTIHGSNISPLDEIFLVNCKSEPRIAIIEIDLNKKATIWSELITCGINCLSMFPELSSISKLLLRSEQ